MTKNRRLLPWVAGLAMAAALCSTGPFFYVFRAAWQRHYPELAAQWANNGKTAFLGWFGTEGVYEELGYADRVNDAANHRLLAYDPYLKSNHSRRQFVINKVTYAVMGLIQMITRDINVTWLATRFLCCLAWFLLLYALSLRLLEEPPPAAFCAAFLTGFSYLLTFRFVYDMTWSGGLLHSLVHDAWSVACYGRTEGVLRLPRAGFTYGMLFLACWTLVKTAETRSWKWAGACALAGASLCYVHLDVWLLYFAAGACFAALCWFKDRKAFWPVLTAGVVAGLCSLPFVLINYPPEHEIRVRTFFAPDDAPVLSTYILVYLPAAWLALRRGSAPIHRLLAAFMLGSAIMVNAGFLLGYNFEPWRWMFLGNIFLFLVAAAWIPRKLARRPAPWLWGIGVLAFCAFLQGVSYAAIHFPFEGLPRDYDDALSWLQKNTARDSTVLTVNPEVNALIPAYTHDKVEIAFVPPVFSDVPLLVNYERFLGALNYFGIDEKRFLKDTLLNGLKETERRETISLGLTRGEIEKNQLWIYLFYITPMPLRQQVMAQAEGHATALDPDFVWFGKLERQYAGKAFPGRRKPAYSNPSVTIYAR